MTVSVSEIELAGQSVPFEDGVFPLCFEAGTADSSQTDEWLRSNAEQLVGDASRHGAILFRGFPLATADDFDSFIVSFGLRNFPYEESLSNAVRVNRTERVFTANEAPSEIDILLHHEMAQTPIYPGKLFFFCEQAAETGGATPICRSDVLLNRLAEERPDFVRDCESKGLLYSNVMPDESDSTSGMGRSWRSTFRAETREAAEERMASLGYSWEWQSDGGLRATTPVLPAVRELPSGRKSFFNQLIAASKGWKDDRNDPAKAITFGDGTLLDVDAINTATEIADDITIDIPWQNGDVALVDNFVVMHGRRNFAGTRKVLASLVAAD